jgi:hypothetical protein
MMFKFFVRLSLRGIKWQSNLILHSTTHLSSGVTKCRVGMEFDKSNRYISYYPIHPRSGRIHAMVFFVINQNATNLLCPFSRGRVLQMYFWVNRKLFFSFIYYPYCLTSSTFYAFGFNKLHPCTYT